MLDLVRVPLLAVVTLLVFKRTRRVPTDRVRLYGAFVDLLCGGWDLAKDVLRTSRFGVTPKIQVLSSLAAEAHSARMREFDPSQVIATAARVLSKRSSEDHERLLNEVLRDGIITQTAGQCRFAHLSFQEYLAVKERLGDLTHDKRDDMMKAYLKGDDWWREVIKFFIGLGETPEKSATWLRAQLPKRREDERAATLWAAFSDAFPDFDMSSYRATPARARDH